MPSRKLPNYIRSHRKCAGFSQKEVAFLLSAGDGASVSRYEHFTQQPTLETAIALEILFRTPVRTLFAGVTEKVEQNVIRRAEELSQKLEEEAQTRVTVRKLEALATLCCELRQLGAQRT